MTAKQADPHTICEQNAEALTAMLNEAREDARQLAKALRRVVEADSFDGHACDKYGNTPGCPGCDASRALAAHLKAQSSSGWDSEAERD